ncbi:Galactose Hypothetical protein lectin domain [Nesidiocoris tenuis]|uniref:SUEL-type lectin domain-containing protein n=1 Tax=Nesidiocoris tenuis TaxID=355587 RepID=A0ABN7AR91_9HEMI|nr:Galactose Hypothetical protein lectin domain [Nesidiocoris tenuis]
METRRLRPALLVCLCNDTNNIALLSGTLRRYEKAACEDESLALSCPPGTSISVEMAHYGTASRAASTLCPPPPPPHVPGGGDGVCDPPSSLQYSLLQTVVEACQKKRSCKFQTSTKSFGGDPCPGVQKYVIVAYKCRPYEFRSKVACENDVVQLQCNPNSRIAVYSASYGRTEYESVQCPQPQGVPEETCLVSYGTETVMQICHGKRRCTLSADSATFGSPCKKESRMYLKVVYTCVPRKVLRDQFEERPEEDENLDMDDDAEYEPIEETENNSLLPSPNLAGRHNATSILQNGAISNGGVTFAPILRVATVRPPVNRTAPPPIEGKIRQTTQQPLDLQNDSGVDAYNFGADPADDSQEKPALINCTLTVHTVRQQTQVVGFLSNWIATYTFLSSKW